MYDALLCMHHPKSAADMINPVSYTHLCLSAENISDKHADIITDDVAVKTYQYTGNDHFFQPMLMERAAAVGGPPMAAIMPTIISSKSNLKILPMENTSRHMTENTMQNAQIIRPPY